MCPRITWTRAASARPSRSTTTAPRRVASRTVASSSSSPLSERKETMRHPRSLLLLILVPLLLLVPSLAQAQDVEKQVSRMNKKAMEDYDSLEFESARKTLIDAVAMLRANGLDETPLAAKV